VSDQNSINLFDLWVTDSEFFRLGKYLMEKMTNGHLKPLHVCKVFSFRETVEAFRYMQQGKQLGKIVISYQDSGIATLPVSTYLAAFPHYPPPRSPRLAINVCLLLLQVRPLSPQLRLRPDASYLIVGGLKGLCGSLAVYMARNGARNIIAMARSGFDDPATQAVLGDLKALGCHVELVVGDVTVLPDVRRAFQQVSSRPVAGVIQGAMVLRDRMFADMTAAEFREPIAPKVRGTWNLHTVSLEQKTPLDFFTMLASVSGVAGHISQSNYGAGNVFQDNVAAYRRQRGLPACTVDLGLVGDVGYLAEHKLMPRLEAQGWMPISEALLHRILCVSILQQQTPSSRDEEDQTGQIITGIAVPIIPPHSPLDPVHRFSTLGASAAELRRGKGGPGEEAAADGVDPKLAILKSVRRGDGGSAAKYDLALAAAVDVINSVLARSLGATAPLEPQRPLASYGIDSLVAVELRNWVRKELALEISGLEVVGAKTLVALCEVILKKMGAGTGSPA
jgi:acyl carrier protein